MLFSAAALSFLSLAGLTKAHGFVSDIKGANGKTENGFGVKAASIRPNNQGPVSVFRAANQPCGVGVEVGPINIASSIEAAVSAGLPTVDSTGSISMIWNQINAGSDGGGPGTAEIDVTGTGKNFKPLTIKKNFADGGQNSKNPVTLKLASNTVCTGGSNKSTCLIKLTNRAGPFGSCFAVASPSSAPAQNNGAQKVAQPNTAAPTRTTPAAQVTAPATPPTSNPSQKSSHNSPASVQSSSKSKGNKKHKHKGSKKGKGNKSKQQKSKKVGNPRNENTVKRDLTNFSRVMAQRASPTTPQPAKRKRKSRVVDSDDEFEQEQPIKAEFDDEPRAATPTKPVIKSKAITRGRKKNVKPPIKAVANDDIAENGSTTPSMLVDATPTEMLKDSELERPAKRQRLPNMRKSLVASISTTPIGSSTPVAEKSTPLPVASSSAAGAHRNIVDGPVTKDVDLRDEDAFSQLFKKSGTGKSETRYDLTSSEKMEHKKVELAQLREQYVAQKARNKGTPFDLGAQNRKLVDVQQTLEQRGSRVCVNVVGSCVLTINRDWIKLAAEKESNPPP